MTRNGDDDDKINWRSKNNYYRSLKLISEELEDYDADNKIPIWGFGAIVPEGKYYN